MAKKDKINLSQAQISQEELSQYGEAIKILSMQEQLTDKLLLVDEKIEEISRKNFDQKLLAIMRDKLVELLDTLTKTYYSRNGDEIEARSLRDLHSLKARQEAISEEGKSALKEKTYFSPEERQFDEVLQDIAARKEAFEGERKGLSRLPFVDHAKKSALDSQIEEIEKQYQILLRDLFDTTKVKKIGKNLEQEYQNRAEQLQKIAEAVKLLARDADYPKMEQEIDNLNFIGEIAVRIAETLENPQSQDFQKLNARACFLELRNYLTKNEAGQPDASPLKKSWQALQTSLDYEKQLENLKTGIGEVLLELQQTITRVKSQASAILSLRSQVLAIESQSEISNKLAAMQESFAKVEKEYKKVEKILKSVLNECETANTDQAKIIGLIEELSSDNLEKVYLNNFYQALADFEGLLQQLRQSEDEKRWCEMLLDDSEHGYESAKDAVDIVLESSRGEVCPGKEQVKASLFNTLTNEQIVELQKLREPTLLIVPDTTAARFQAAVDKSACKTMPGQQDAYFGSFYAKALDAIATQAGVPDDQPKITKYRFVITEGRQHFDAQASDHDFAWNKRKIMENEDKIAAFEAYRKAHPGLTCLNAAMYLMLMIWGIKQGKPTDSIKDNRRQFTLLPGEPKTAHVKDGLVADGLWDEELRLAGFSLAYLDRGSDNARLREAVMGEIS